MKTFTVAVAQDETAAAAAGLPLVRLCAEARDGRLTLHGGRGGLLGVFGEVGEGEADALSGELLRLRGCDGLLLDVGTGEGAAALAARLDGRCALFVPLELAAAAPHARLIASSALSGGSLMLLLDELCAQYGARRLCLELVRTRALFPMPSPDPDGRALTEAELSALRQRAGPAHFSPELCADYASFEEDGQPRLLLWDDAHSAREKLRLARERDLSAAFLLWSEWGAELASGAVR